MKPIKLSWLLLMLMFIAVGCKEKESEPPQQVVTEGEEKPEKLTEADEALLFAADRGDIGKIQSLILSGADVNAAAQNGLSALHLAAVKGHKPVIEFLLAKGADMNANDKDGMTPLHLAVLRGPFQGHKDLAQLLIDKGADVNAENQAGLTPLHYAKVAGHQEIVELLRKHGATE